MARIAQEELERRGRDLVGCCPFHEDDTPSLVISPRNNLWHCLGACQQGGSVIDWVMRSRGVSFRHAVELLRAEHPSLAADPTAARRGGRQKGVVPERSGQRPLADDAFDVTADDDALMQQVVDFYHQSLLSEPEALGYLERRGLGSAEMISHFRLGFAGRTLGYRLPPRTRKAGAAMRERLTALGILRSSGHEHLSGSVVVPVFGADGRVLELYGRRIHDNLRKGTPRHLYLPGPHRGVFNEAGLGQGDGEVIWCESLLDALAFWQAGLRHVSASFGTSGFSEDHRAALEARGIERVYIAYDRDKAGDRAAQKLSVQLSEMGIESFRVLFPKGMDACEYALKVTPASRSLKLAVQQAQWMASGRASSRPVAHSAQPPPPSAPRAVAESRPAAEPTPSSAAVERSPAAAVVDEERSEVRFVFGERRWRVRSLGHKPQPGSLRVNLFVEHRADGVGGGGFFVDTLEMYAAKQRAAFVAAAAAELGLEPDVVKRDLGAVLLGLEQLRAEDGEDTNARAPELSEDECAQALELLRDPHLIERLLTDFEHAGVVGERNNKLLGYLAAVSRKLDRPLAVVIQSSSAAGKSSLMEAILAFVPEEERIQYSAMTGQSLFYMGELDLRHRILAIVEEEGAERASYALKLLQSEGELTIASTGKDPTTGRLVTQEYRVQGPVMIMLTTTAIDVDEELLNRCIVLTVDESQAQTRAIHAAQRRAETLEGLMQRREHHHLRKLHQNAQRLLRPLCVVNPHAERLRFFDHKTRTRRDHTKYLTLMRAIALLHQHQRPIRTATHRGERIEYIEVTEHDIALAESLSRSILARGIDELPPQTRRLLADIEALVIERAREQRLDPREVRFTRRDVRRACGWSHAQLKVHMRRLEELEHLVVFAGGPRRRLLYGIDYDLNWSGAEPTGRPLVGDPPRPVSRNGHAPLPALVAVDSPHGAGKAPLRVVDEAEAVTAG